jgi:hypothetical protein
MCKDPTSVDLPHRPAGWPVAPQIKPPALSPSPSHIHPHREVGGRQAIHPHREVGGRQASATPDEGGGALR